MLIPMKRMTIVLMLFTALFSSISSAKEIALTFDDAPRGDTPLLGTGEERTRLLIENLKKADVPQVVIFANTHNFHERGKARIDRYVKAGHLIANHTHSHPNVLKTELGDYVSDIRRAHETLKTREGFTPLFRFPYLREGETRKKRDGLRAELKSLGLRNGYITVDTYDWSFDFQVQEAIKAGKTVDREALGKLYVDILMKDVEHDDGMARKLLKRSPKHVILLHENDVAALYVGDLVAALRKAGWKIIAPAEAYEDSISTYLAKTIAPHNPGRIGEIARDRGVLKKKWWSDHCDEDLIGRRLVETKSIR